MQITPEEFYQCICGSDSANKWAEGRSPHLCRIFNIFNPVPNLSGPTLDIGSEHASFFRPLNKFRPDLLPYQCADLDGEVRVIDGVTVPGCRFECDKDRLPFESESLGLVLLTDVIEHLLIDPVWTLLEINRVLKIGGHFVVSTPNVTGISRVFKILRGYHPGTEHEFKPTSLYDRHNREWTAMDICHTLNLIGFNIANFDTNHEAISSLELELLHQMRDRGVVTLEDIFFGPDIVAVGQKRVHLTLDMNLPDEMRWPDFLYTGYDCYRKRPAHFPQIKPLS